MEVAIKKTLIYADLFDFPLTKDELWQRLIWRSQAKPSKKDFEAILKKLVSKAGYYFLPGREKIIKIRRRREQEARRKLEKARAIVRFLQFCPWVWFIGLSGSVAANNARPSDDIDLFIITAPQRLWLTRLWLILVLELLHSRRRPKDRQFRDKICLNFLLDADHLDYFNQQKDIFLAYELFQLKPLFQRHNTYYQLLSANSWVKDFLPNWLPFSSQKLSRRYQSSRNRQSIIGHILENWAYRFQVWLMRRRRTREMVKPFLAAFHPTDFRHQVLARFRQRIGE